MRNRWIDYFNECFCLFLCFHFTQFYVRLFTDYRYCSVNLCEWTYSHRSLGWMLYSCWHLCEIPAFTRSRCGFCWWVWWAWRCYHHQSKERRNKSPRSRGQIPRANEKKLSGIWDKFWPLFKDFCQNPSWNCFRIKALKPNASEDEKVSSLSLSFQIIKQQ